MAVESGINMESPPPFQATTAPKSDSSKACLIAVIVIVAFCIVLGVAGFFMARNVMGEVSPLAKCAATLDTTRDALKAYSMEHNGKLPNAETWQTDVAPYYDRIRDKLRKEGLPNDFTPSPINEPLGCKWSNSMTGVAFNIELSGKSLAEIKNKESTALVFEVPEVKVNQALKFDPNLKTKPPKLFYNDRDWMVYYIEGDNEPLDSSNSSMDFESKPEDGLSTAPKSGK